MGPVVTKKLEDVNEIVNIYGLYGIYDYIIELEANSVDRIKDVVLNKIRGFHNIKSSITLLTYGDSFINE
jgi:DNA-binding Lrp family transcriptional regulator